MWENNITRAGGGIGGIMAYMLNVNLSHIIEVAIFALIGSAIGEGVKEAVKYAKNRYSNKGGNPS